MLDHHRKPKSNGGQAFVRVTEGPGYESRVLNREFALLRSTKLGRKGPNPTILVKCDSTFTQYTLNKNNLNTHAR